MRFAYILLNSLLNGVSTPVLKKLGEIVPIYPVILIRGIISLCIFRGITQKRGKLTKRDKLLYLAVITLSTIGFFTYYTSLKLVDVGLIAIFTINVTMIFTLILAAVILKEGYTAPQWFFILLSLLSLTVLTFESIKIDLNIGILLLLINSTVNSIGAILTKKILDSRCGNELSFVRTSLDVTLSALVLAVTPLLIIEFISKLTIVIALLIAFLAVNSVLLAVLYNKSVKEIGVSLTDILKNLTVVVAIIIGVTFMGDTYTTPQYITLGVFILSTFTIIALKGRQPKQVTPTK